MKSLMNIALALALILPSVARSQEFAAEGMSRRQLENTIDGARIELGTLAMKLKDVKRSRSTALVIGVTAATAAVISGGLGVAGLWVTKGMPYVGQAGRQLSAQILVGTVGVTAGALVSYQLFKVKSAEIDVLQKKIEETIAALEDSERSLQSLED